MCGEFITQRMPHFVCRHTEVHSKLLARVRIVMCVMHESIARENLVLDYDYGGAGGSYKAKVKASKRLSTHYDSDETST